MRPLNLELEEPVADRLNQIAKDANLPLERACELVLAEFARQEGGRVYVGSWKEKEGLMFVVQWPFLTGFVKVPGSELGKMGVR